MKSNMGTLDRTLRLLIAASVAVLYFTDQINGTAAIILGLLALVFVATSALGSCPLYSIFNISTRKQKSQAQ